jgi:RNA polymerase sigma-70 factor (ECF subfamily)
MSRYQNANNFNEGLTAGDLFSDTATFEIFFKQNFISFCAYCQFKFGFDPEQSKDVVHTSFVKFWENRHVLEPHSPVKPFLYKIINNSCLDILKHDKVKRAYVSYQIQKGNIQDCMNVLENVEFKQLSEDIHAAVAALPLQMQKIFKLCKYERMTYAEVALTLNLSIKTVEKQMGRALFKLRQKLSVYLGCFLVALLSIV